MAAGVNIWLGNVSTDPATAGNWSKTPEAGDTLRFDATAVKNCAGGAVGVQVASVTITRDCSINFGTSIESPLVLDCSAGVMDEGTGSGFFSIANATSWYVHNTGTRYIDGIAGTAGALTIDASSSSIYVGPNIAAAARFAKITVIRGTVTLTKVEALAGGGAAPALSMTGGTVDAWDALAAVTVAAGLLRQHSQNITTLVLSTGGSLDASDHPGLTIGTTTMYDGSSITDPLNAITYTAPIVNKGSTISVN